MSEFKWRFPASKHGEKRGITYGDVEAFRNRPYQAFAREIIQNSIDARDSDESPVEIEFSSFELDRDSLPGFAELEAQIRRCKELWAHKEDYRKTFDNFFHVLGKEKIQCLRVSDYNTTGLVGVDSIESDGNKFLALTKGTGVSEKTDSSHAGGSKGMGKNAAFLMSKIMTVFYSTNANRGLKQNDLSRHFGYIGVANLCSGWIDDEHKNQGDDYTQGTGYYSPNESNLAIPQVLNLDETCQKDRNEEFGTDIYILGFEPEEGWQSEVIFSILESFLAAIYYRDLSVVVEGKRIDSESLEAIVHSDEIAREKSGKDIISQYLLLANPDGLVKTYDIETEYGDCQLYVLPLRNVNSDLATHKCAMIRYPYMKIKDINVNSSFAVSALCIIGKGKIGSLLREIENPQHTNWEPKRIENAEQRKEYTNLIKSITEQIKENVNNCLSIDAEQEIDPNGAGDFLPDVADQESSSDGNGAGRPQEEVTLSSIRENITIEKNANINRDDGNGLEPDIGEAGDSAGDDVYLPDGENYGKDGPMRPGPNTAEKAEGDDVVFQRKKLSGVRYRVIATNKDEGRLRVTFNAPITYESCYLAISLIDDNNSPTPVEITDLEKNGTAIICDDHREYGPFGIREGEKVVLNLSTNTKGYFGSEVKIICK